MAEKLRLNRTMMVVGRKGCVWSWLIAPEGGNAYGVSLHYDIPTASIIERLVRVALSKP